MPVIVIVCSVFIIGAAAEESKENSTANDAVEIVSCTSVTVNGVEAGAGTGEEKKQAAAAVCPPVASCPVTTTKDYSKTDYQSFVTERVELSYYTDAARLCQAMAGGNGVIRVEGFHSVEALTQTAQITLEAARLELAEAQAALKNLEDQLTTAKSELEAAQGGEANGGASVEDLQAKVTELEAGIITAKTLVLNKQAAVNAADYNVTTIAQLSFAQARENDPFLMTLGQPGANDPLLRVFLYAFDDRQTIIIRGLYEDVMAAKRLIGQYDVPAAQARLTVWSLQLNTRKNTGSIDRLNEAGDIITDEFRGTRERISATLSILRDCIVEKVNEVAIANGNLNGAPHQYAMQRFEFYSPYVLSNLGYNMHHEYWDDLYHSERSPGYLRNWSHYSFTRYVIPDPANISTMGEAMVVLTLARRNYREEILDTFERRLDTYLCNRDLHEDCQDFRFHRLRRALGADYHPVTEDVDFVKTAGSPERLPDSDFYTDRWPADGIGREPFNEALTANQFIILHALQRQALEKVLPLVNQMNQEFLDEIKGKVPLTEGLDDMIELIKQTDARSLESGIARFAHDGRGSAELTGKDIRDFCLEVCGCPEETPSEESPEGESSTARKPPAWATPQNVSELTRFYELMSYVEDVDADQKKEILLAYLHVADAAVKQDQGSIFDTSLKPHTERALRDFIDWYFSYQYSDEVNLARYGSVFTESRIWPPIPPVTESDTEGLSSGPPLCPSMGGGKMYTWECFNRNYHDLIIAIRVYLDHVSSTKKMFAWLEVQTGVNRARLKLFAQNNKASHYQLQFFDQAETDARVAEADELLKTFSKAMEDEINEKYIQPMVRRLRTEINDKKIEVGIIERTSMMSTNREVARIKPSATAQLRLGTQVEILSEALDILGLTDKFRESLVTAAAGTATDTADASGDTTAGDEGKTASSTESVKKLDDASLLQLLTLVSDFDDDEDVSEIYGINTGSEFKTTPYFGPTGQGLRFDFDYTSFTEIEDPVVDSGKPVTKLPRVSKNEINTEMQLHNFEIRQAGSYDVTSRLGIQEKRTGGIPVLRHIKPFRDVPILGWFTKRRGSDAVLQQSVIFVQTTIYPTIGDIQNMLTLPRPSESVYWDKAENGAGTAQQPDDRLTGYITAWCCDDKGVGSIQYYTGEGLPTVIYFELKNCSGTLRAALNAPLDPALKTYNPQLYAALGEICEIVAGKSWQIKLTDFGEPTAVPGVVVVTFKPLVIPTDSRTWAQKIELEKVILPEPATDDSAKKGGA